MTHLKSDKPQTKLGILNMAVEVIMGLEQQVRGASSFFCLFCLFENQSLLWSLLHAFNAEQKE
jgi:hypothetical protein